MPWSTKSRAAKAVFKRPQKAVVSLNCRDELG
jgi:hypothetical protein